MKPERITDKERRRRARARFHPVRSGTLGQFIAAGVEWSQNPRPCMPVPVLTAEEIAALKRRRALASVVCFTLGVPYPPSYDEMQAALAAWRE